MRVGGTTQLGRVIMQLDGTPKIKRLVNPRIIVGAGRTRTEDVRRIEMTGDTVTLFTETGWVDLPDTATVSVTITIDDGDATDSVGFPVAEEVNQ